MTKVAPQAAEPASLVQVLIGRTLRIPTVATRDGDGEGAARQLDVALMSVGFKLSREVLQYLGARSREEVEALGREVLAAVRTTVGDHVQHNVYFKDFPHGVPDTWEFWMQQATHIFLTDDGEMVLAVDLSKNLTYGRYQHSYEEMLAAHDAFIPSVKDRVTVLSLGRRLHEEADEMLRVLAASPVPLNESDRNLLRRLAEYCDDAALPSEIPVRENLAIVNAVRVRRSISPTVDTIADVLRLACALCGGDVTLQEPTKFKSLSRGVRRTLMSALDAVVSRAEAKLGDVARYREPLKRLGERLHPHEFPTYPSAQDVFSVARGERAVRSLAGRVESAFARGRILEVVELLAANPGLFARSLDRILRRATPGEWPQIVSAFRDAAPRVAGRVLLSLRENLLNRGALHPTRRLYANSRARAWVAPETRLPLDSNVIRAVDDIIDAEILRRLPDPGHIMVDPAIRPIAIPTSEKNKAGGFGVMPRGSILPVEPGIIRFFIYWKQKRQATDFDLSAVILGSAYEYRGHLSYTNLQAAGGVHSGDITEAPQGASEFIDIDLSRINGDIVIPSVNLFAGETFSEVQECFFGFMSRTEEQKGQPFEAATVRLKSDLRGAGRVCLPLAFLRRGDGSWQAHWLHLYLAGQAQFNTVEGAERAASLLTRALVERQFLRVDYLVSLLQQKASPFSWHEPTSPASDDVDTWIGLERPQGLRPDARVFTLTNLFSLVPE